MENRINQHSHENEAQSSSSSSPYAPGYRFMPTDQELITEYLIRKVKNEPIPIDDMNEVNLYDHNPHDLAVSYPRLGDNEWYFFTPRDRKYPNGKRPNRAVGEVGFWKATGADKAIESNGKEIGRKRVLVFHVGKPKPEVATKTDWIMHEYRLDAPSKSPNARDMRLDDWVLCRIYQKPKRPNKRQRDVEEDVIENTVALNIQNNNNNNNNAINIQNNDNNNNNAIDQSQLIIHNNNNNAIDQSQLIIHNNNNNAIDQSQLNINNNYNAIDQSQDNRGLGVHNEYQPNYYYRDGFDQVPGNFVDVATSQDMNFDYGFDYRLSLWGDYGMGNQGTNGYAHGLDSDLKKIVDDFIRDEVVGLPKDDEQPKAKRREN